MLFFSNGGGGGGGKGVFALKTPFVLLHKTGSSIFSLSILGVKKKGIYEL